MTALTLIWRQPDPPVVLQWRGPDEATRVQPYLPGRQFVAANIGPPGPDGPTLQPGDGIDVVGTEIRIDINSLPTAP